ncbi:MAG: SAM-dependent methyltransferase [Pseudonocardiales bacterium]|nr:SAM-dependent methyltransferase [Pseudonocardiales bacterium]
MDILLLREFLRNPLGIAAVTSSSAAMATLLSVAIPESGEPVVVELGAGTGACTGVIQHRLCGRGRHIALEVNPTFAELLTRRYPTVEVVCGKAEDLPTFLADRGAPSADVIISTLPWAPFAPSATPRPLLAILAESLVGGGAYTQAAYTWTRWAPPARRQLWQLRASFEEVVISETIWRNVPPARVYIARRPRNGQRPG